MVLTLTMNCPRNELRHLFSKLVCQESTGGWGLRRKGYLEGLKRVSGTVESNTSRTRKRTYKHPLKQKHKEGTHHNHTKLSQKQIQKSKELLEHRCVVFLTHWPELPMISQSTTLAAHKGFDSTSPFPWGPPAGCLQDRERSFNKPRRTRCEPCAVIEQTMCKPCADQEQTSCSSPLFSAASKRPPGQLRKAALCPCFA